MANHICMAFHTQILEADGTLRFAAWAEDVFRRYVRRWKRGTLAVNRSYLRTRILPWFADRLVADITRGEVERPAEAFDLEQFRANPNPRLFEPDRLETMDLTEEEWTSFRDAIREAREV